MSTAMQVFRPKRIALVFVFLAAFLLLFVMAVRITVNEIFRGVAAQRATGLATLVPWDVENTWSSGATSLDALLSSSDQVSRSADLRLRSSSFDESLASLRRTASIHRGYFEEFRTESRSGRGRSLAAILAVPSSDFDSTLSDLKTLGRTEAISQAGEDSAVKIATAARHVDATRTNLSRLQRLQRERKGELRDAVALEKDIAQATEAVAEAESRYGALVSTSVHRGLQGSANSRSFCHSSYAS